MDQRVTQGLLIMRPSPPFPVRLCAESVRPVFSRAKTTGLSAGLLFSCLALLGCLCGTQASSRHLPTNKLCHPEVQPPHFLPRPVFCIHVFLTRGVFAHTRTVISLVGSPYPAHYLPLLADTRSTRPTAESPSRDSFFSGPASDHRLAERVC